MCRLVLKKNFVEVISEWLTSIFACYKINLGNFKTHQVLSHNTTNQIVMTI